MNNGERRNVTTPEGHLRPLRFITLVLGIVLAFASLLIMSVVWEPHSEEMRAEIDGVILGILSVMCIRSRALNRAAPSVDNRHYHK